MTRLWRISPEADLAVDGHVLLFLPASGSAIRTRGTVLRRFCWNGIAFVAGLLGGGQDPQSATMEARAMEIGTEDRRIACVIITHNRVNSVIQSLEQLARLAERPRKVLVDNGSTDGTAAVVSERFPDVEIISTGKNIGAAARTVGVERAAAPYVALCDDDTWWESGSLRRAADLFDALPRLAVITARVLVGPENREDGICEVLARSPLPRQPGMPGPSLLGFLAGASVVRRDVFLEVGGFEPRFFIGGEEELLAADLAARGYWLCYVPELVVHHHPSLVRDGQGRRLTTARNALWFTWLRRPWPIALGRTIRYALSQNGDPGSLRALGAALPGLPWALSHRRLLPPDVERGLRLLERDN